MEKREGMGLNPNKANLGQKKRSISSHHKTIYPSAAGKEETSHTLFLKVKERRIEMEKNFTPEKYGMVICPLCGGKGFLIKQSGQINVTARRVCTKCEGFGAIKKEEKVFRSLEN